MSIAARQQTDGIEQVRSALTSMEQTSQRTAALAEEAAAASEELAAQSEVARHSAQSLAQLSGASTETDVEASRRRARADAAAPGGVVLKSERFTTIESTAVTDNELAFLRDDPEMADLFLAEALDHLGTIEAALLALDERPGDVTLLNDIFRPFHTIKGNAGALGVTSVQEVAHRVENLLDLARSGRHTMGPADVDVVLRAVDVLTSMIRDVGARLAGQPRTDLAPVAQALIEVCRRAASRVRRMRHAQTQPAAATLEDAVFEAAAPSGEGSAAASLRARSDGDAAARPVARDENAAIKVDTRKLDSLVDAVGELIIVQSLIQEDPLLASHVDSRLASNLGQLKRITAGLQRSAMALRMVPIRQAFQKVSRIVRDLSRKADKSVELVLSG